MTVRVGFLGAGFIAQVHAYQLGRCETDHEVVGVYDPDADKAAALASWQKCPAMSSSDEVIAASDAVIICTWTSEHPAMLGAVVNAGRAVLCEKPLAVDLATATEMVHLVESSGVINSVGLVLRSTPAICALRELINEPDVGRVMNVVFRDDQYIPIQGMYRSDWRADPTRAGAGALIEHSIHDLDILEWLFGSMVSISAVTSEFHGFAGIEDSVSALVRFEGGHSATLTSVWHDVLSRTSLRRIEVFCERALITLEGDDEGPLTWERTDLDGVSTTGSIDGTTLEPWLHQRNAMPALLEESFLAAVAAGGPSASPTIADALRAHVLVDAAYRSAAAGGATIDTSIT